MTRTEAGPAPGSISSPEASPSSPVTSAGLAGFDGVLCQRHTEIRDASVLRADVPAESSNRRIPCPERLKPASSSGRTCEWPCSHHLRCKRSLHDLSICAWVNQTAPSTRRHPENPSCRYRQPCESPHPHEPPAMHFHRAPGCKDSLIHPM